MLWYGHRLSGSKAISTGGLFEALGNSQMLNSESACVF